MVNARSGLGVMAFGLIVSAAAGSTEACGGDPANAIELPDGLAPDGDDPTQLKRDGGADGGAKDTASATSAIRHVVLIVQENHTFDTYFSSYCTAPVGSNPRCTTGPSCCETAPTMLADGSKPVVLDDTQNAAYDPDHTQPCERAETNAGAMDRYTTDLGKTCARSAQRTGNFALAPKTAVGTYHEYAQKYAIADRYFQPIVGQTSANDMYFAAAKKMFTDNEYYPAAIGQGCSPLQFTSKKMQFTGQKTVADVLIDAGHTMTFYAEGYNVMRNAATCPKDPPDCKSSVPLVSVYPCAYDPSDNAFNYYEQFADNPNFLKDWTMFDTDLKANKLADVSYIKAIGYHTEHPGYGTKISSGQTFVKNVVDAIQASPYAADTLVLIAWDEGGGYYDHISPPQAKSPIDNEEVGTRVPFIAIGPFVKQNSISHVQLEHSSIVKFLEYNFTGKTGQLGARDTLVHNLGSLFDPTKTGIVIPED